MNIFHDNNPEVMLNSPRFNRYIDRLNSVDKNLGIYFFLIIYSTNSF
jgi:hypothetical protein